METNAAFWGPGPQRRVLCSYFWFLQRLSFRLGTGPLIIRKEIEVEMRDVVVGGSMENR